jgi:hypothetical protein
VQYLSYTNQQGERPAFGNVNTCRSKSGLFASVYVAHVGAAAPSRYACSPTQHSREHLTIAGARVALPGRDASGQLSKPARRRSGL